MAHLKSELRECCKKCIYLGYYDDRHSSWFYCGYLGDAYDIAANNAVDNVISTVFEKRGDDLIPCFYKVYADEICCNALDLDTLVSAVECGKTDSYTDALIRVLRKYGNK